MNAGWNQICCKALFRTNSSLTMGDRSTLLISEFSPHQDIHVREAIPQDFELLADIYNESICSGRSTMDSVPVHAEYFTSLVRRFSTRETLLIAEYRSAVVAWGIVKQYSDRPGYTYACETSVYVAGNSQGRGVGSVLQAAVVDQARSFGYRHLVAKILAVNKSSISFHYRFHYEIVGIQREIGFLNGSWHDVVIMQRVLNDVLPQEKNL